MTPLQREYETKVKELTDMITLQQAAGLLTVRMLLLVNQIQILKDRLDNERGE